MQRILFVTDALRLREQSVAFAAYLCKLSRSSLTAIFLEDTFSDTRSGDAIRTSAMEAGIILEDVPAETIKRKSCAENIKRLRAACAVEEITCNIHRECGEPVQEAIRESAFADLMLVDADTSFRDLRDPVPTKFVKELLNHAQCPVIVMPESFDGIQQLVFTYDGKRSSVFAIKQFTYLFPALNHLPVTLLTIDADNRIDPDDHQRLREWLEVHYTNVSWVNYETSVRAGLIEELIYKHGAFIVMGAYGRSALSTAFQPSHANQVLELVTQPVFITHDH